MSKSLRLLSRPLIWMALLNVIAFYGIFSLEAKADFPSYRVNICVKDKQGNAIPGARVTIERATTGGLPPKTWTTDLTDGCINELRQINLKASYKLVVEAEGYKALSEELQLTQEPLVSKKVELEKKVDQNQGNSGSSSETVDPPQTGTADSGNIFSRSLAAATGFISNHWLTGLACLLPLALLVMGWRQGYRMGLYHLREPAPTIAQQVQTIVESVVGPLALNIQWLKTEQEKMGRKQDNILEKLDKIQPPESRDVTFEAEPAEQPFISVASQGGITKQSQTPQALLNVPSVPSFQESAQSAYRSLLRGSAVFPAPVYLNSEVSNSPMDMLGDSKVYLQEVGGMQGTFVLFEGEDDRGCVFPNPNLRFRPQVLSPVFPNLTEAQFTSDAENIKPVFVSRVDGNRWKVESNNKL